MLNSDCFERYEEIKAVEHNFDLAACFRESVCFLRQARVVWQLASRSLFDVLCFKKRKSREKQ